MGINSSGNMFSLCSANYGIEKLIVMEKQGGKNMESKKSESDNQKIHIFLAGRTCCRGCNIRGERWNLV